MKTFVLTETAQPARLAMADRPTPKPAGRQVLIRVRAAALNYRDVEIAHGVYHTPFQLPLVPLSDGVGDVVEVGEHVTRFSPGDRVCTTFWQDWNAGPFRGAGIASQLGGPMDGLLSEYVCLDENGLVRAPTTLSDVEAATLPCAAVTAWHALITEGRLKPGDTVLTLGTGGVSLFALQIARLAGAQVIVTSSSDEKLQQAKAMGARDTINYRSNPHWGGTVRDLTHAVGVDHVVELGGAATFAQSLEAVRIGGQISLIGYAGGKQGDINPLDIFRR